MPSVDIVNEIDLQAVDNAVNNANKELHTRWDFKGSKAQVEFNRKEKSLVLTAEDEMKIKALMDILITQLIRQKLEPKVLDAKEPEGASGGTQRQQVRIREGIDKDQCKDIVKRIKALNLKVQPAIQDNQVRLTGKKIDDLQAVMAHLRDADLPVPLQFVNMKR